MSKCRCLTIVSFTLHEIIRTMKRNIFNLFLLVLTIFNYTDSFSQLIWTLRSPGIESFYYTTESCPYSSPTIIDDTTYYCKDGYIVKEVYSGISGGANSIISLDDTTFWIGTSKGLCKMEGNKWYTFTTNNSDIPGNRVRDLSLHPNGDLWVSTTNGIGVYDGSTWINFDTNNSILETNDNKPLKFDLAIDDFGTVYANMNLGGLYTYDGSDWLRIGSGSDAFAVGGDGTLYRNGGWGAISVTEKGEPKKTYSYDEGTDLEDGWAWCFVIDGDDKYCGGDVTMKYNSSKDRWDRYGYRPASILHVLDNGDAYSTYFDPEYGLKGPTKQFTTQNSMIPDNWVLEITETPSGKIVVGTQAGLSILDKEVWTNYTIYNTGHIYQNTTLHFLSKNHGLFLGKSDGSVLQIFNDVTTKHDSTNSPLTGTVISNILERSNGDIYIATNKSRLNPQRKSAGLLKFDGTSWTQYLSSNSPNQFDDITFMTCGDGDLIYISGGLQASEFQSFDGTSWSSTVDLDDFTPCCQHIIGMLADSKGRLWLSRASTSDAFYRYKNEVWEKFDVPSNHQVTRTKDIFKPSNNVMYFNSGYTPLKRVAKYDGKKWTRVDLEVADVGYIPPGTFEFGKTNTFLLHQNNNVLKYMDGSKWLKIDSLVGPTQASIGRIIQLNDGSYFSPSAVYHGDPLAHITNLASANMNLDKEINLSVNPNPSNGDITLTWKSKNPQKIILSDTKGYILRSPEKPSLYSSKLDLTGLNPGIYIIKITDTITNISSSERIIIE